MSEQQKIISETTQTKIIEIKKKLLNKIFDVYEYNNIKYFIDNENKLIWDNEKNAVGIISKNNEKIFFTDSNEILDTFDPFVFY